MGKLWQNVLLGILARIPTGGTLATSAAVLLAMAAAAVADLALWPDAFLAPLYLIPLLIAALVASPRVVLALAVVVDVLGTYGTVRTGSAVRPLSLEMTSLLVTSGLATILARKRQQSERQAREQRVLEQVGESLARQVSLEAIARVVVGEARQVLEVAGVGLWLLDPTRQELRLLASRGLTEKDARANQILSLADPAPSALAVRRARPVEVGNGQTTDPELAKAQQWVESRGVRAGFAQPLLGQDGVLGVLGFSCPYPHRFTSNERALVQTLAGLCAVAIERVRLYEQVEQRAREAEQARQQIASILAGVPSGVVVQDGTGRFVYANEAAARILDFPAAATLVGRVLDDVLGEFQITTEDGREQTFASLAEWLALVATPGVGVTLQFRRRSDGPERWLNVRATLILGADRQIASAINVFDDVTQRKHAEAEREALLRRERAAIRARDEFLAIAAHELKTPITSLRGFAQLELTRLENRGTVELARIRHALRIIDTQSRRLADLVSQLVDVSLIEAGRLKLHLAETNVGELVEGVAATAQGRTQRHRIEVRAAPDLVALVDPARFSQVVASLLDNAIKYSPDGGPIDVEVALAPTGLVRVAVRDRGVGIPPEHRDHLFSRFYQAHPDLHFGGMGLSLYVGQQIIRLHGGAIVAEHPPDGGTRFVIGVPVGVPRSPRPPPLQERIASGGGGAA